jgi:nitroreductase
MENNQTTIVDSVIKGRHSVRAFLPTLVSKETLEELLTVASYAPSSANIQPWKVYVATGSAQQRLKDNLYKTFIDPDESKQHIAELTYYPDEWTSPYKDRRQQVGLELYRTLDIKRDDKIAMLNQHSRNMLFFDAPVTLVFTIDRDLALGSRVDCGMFIQTVMLAAQARGLATCAQASINQFHTIIRKELAIPETEQLICGISLGYEDKSDIVNTVKSTRAPLSEFVKFVED